MTQQKQNVPHRLYVGDNFMDWCLLTSHKNLYRLADVHALCNHTPTRTNAGLEKGPFTTFQKFLDSEGTSNEHTRDNSTRSVHSSPVAHKHDFEATMSTPH